MRQYTQGNYDPAAPSPDAARRFVLMRYVGGPLAGSTAIWGWHLAEQIPDRLTARHRGDPHRYERDGQDYRHVGEGIWPEHKLGEQVPVDGAI